MQGLIEKIAVLVLDSSGCVVERFTMQLKVLNTWLTQTSRFRAQGSAGSTLERAGC